MATSSKTANDQAQTGAAQGTSSFATLETSPDPDPAPSETASSTSERPKGLLTVLAVLAAMGLAAASVVLPMDMVAQTTTVDLVIVGGFAFAVALAGMLPMRWGLWVVPGVAAAHYGLNFYNILFTESSVYSWVPGDAYGYALFTPLVGVVLGFVLQGVYKLAAGE